MSLGDIPNPGLLKSKFEVESFSPFLTSFVK